MVCACASWVGVPRCVMGAVAAGAAVDVAAALAPMPPLVPPPARLLTPPLVPLARARVISWVDYRSLSRWASPRPVAFPKQFGNYPARRRRLRALWQRRWEGKQTALTACGCAPIRSLRRFSAIAVSRLRHFGPSGYAALAKTHVRLRVFAPFGGADKNLDQEGFGKESACTTGTRSNSPSWRWRRA